jgi:hypothetical protein
MAALLGASCARILARRQNHLLRNLPGEVGDAGSMARVLVMLEGILTPTGRAKLVR